MQIGAFFFCVYFDSIYLTQGVIAYFSEEFYSSGSAWLGCLFIGLMVFVEGVCLNAYKLIQEMNPNHVNDAAANQVQNISLDKG